MAKQQLSPRQRYGEIAKREIFGTPASGERSTAWLSEKTGISTNTIRSWRKDPGRIPAYRYLQLMAAIKAHNV